LCIGKDSVVAPVLECILALRLDIGATYQYGSEFVFPDPAVQDFFLARFSIKKPLAIVSYNGNRKGPVLVAYMKNHL
jgi:hypothetical protein